LSPNLSRCGSFPIDKIIWNMGDGTSDIEINRYELPTNPNFIYTGLFESDIYDPRNYDVLYTYIRHSKNIGCYYPSITAVATTTETTDCAATTIGPIEFERINEFHLLQNHLLTDKTKIYLGEFNSGVGIWSHK
jgi:hypothetical protein